MTRLLVVDDNPQSLYMLQVLLSASGFKVELASNGAEALEQARRAPPDMIISDILMPVMDGFALCRACKQDEQLKGIPFVFYTATYTDPKDEDFALSLGAERFIVKPVEPDRFLALLRETIETHQAGKLLAPREPIAEAAEYYKQYSAALIRKLEDKVLQLEEANRALELDIARRKQAEEALSLSQAQLRATLYSIGDAVIATDDQGRVTMMNPVAEKLTGWAEAEAQGKLLEEVLHIVNEETRASVENPVARVLREGVVIGLANHTLLIARDGAEYVIADAGAPIRDAAGRIAGVVLVFRDQTEERRAQCAVQEARQFAEGIVATVREPLVVLDADLRVVSANRAFYRNFQVTPEETQGRLLYDLGNRQWDIPELRRLLGEILPQNTSFDDYEVRHNFERLGERVMQLNARRIYHEANKTQLILLAIEDITERKQAEEALRASELLFHSLIESLPQNIYAKDLQGRFIFANQRYCATQGKSLAEIVGRTDMELHPPELAEKYRRDDRRVIETGQPLELEEEHQPLGGPRFFVQVIKTPLYDSHRQIVGTLGIFWDITERKRMENMLRESEARFRALFEKAGIGIALMDIVGGKLITCNPALSDILGYSEDELRALSIRDTTHPDDLAADWELWNKMLEGQCDFYTLEKRYYRKDGQLIWGRLIVSLVRDTAGKPLLAISMLEDITTRKQAEAKLAEQLDELRRWYTATLGREGRVLDLKREVNELLARLGELPRYPSAAPDA